MASVHKPTVSVFCDVLEVVRAEMIQRWGEGCGLVGCPAVVQFCQNKTSPWRRNCDSWGNFLWSSCGPVFTSKNKTGSLRTVEDLRRQKLKAQHHNAAHSSLEERDGAAFLWTWQTFSTVSIRVKGQKPVLWHCVLFTLLCFCLVFMLRWRTCVPSKANYSKMNKLVTNK